MARYIPYFQSQVGYPDLDVTNMLLELVTDNSKILDRLGEAEIKMFVYWLRQRMSPPFLDFLRSLCICEDKEVAENQDLVARLLWEEHDKNQLLFLVRIASDGKGLEVKKSATTPWVPMKSLSTKKGGDVQPRETASAAVGRCQQLNHAHHFHACRVISQMDFLSKELELLSDICTGRENEHVHRIGNEIIPFSVAFQGATDNDLPPKLRRCTAMQLDSCQRSRLW